MRRVGRIGSDSDTEEERSVFGGLMMAVWRHAKIAAHAALRQIPEAEAEQQGFEEATARVPEMEA